jgi:hypothetical protein
VIIHELDGGFGILVDSSWPCGAKMYKTLIVEDNDNFRQTLRSLLDSRFPSMTIEEAGEGS